jgi:dGTPase
MINATAHSGRIGMEPDMAEALSLFRQFNYERIYDRPESKAQANSVISMLRTLIDHYIKTPLLLPAWHETPFEPGSLAAITEAVSYVGGMTDRFACRQAVTLLDYPTDKLPQGIDTLMSDQ